MIFFISKSRFIKSYCFVYIFDRKPKELTSLSFNNVYNASISLNSKGLNISLFVSNIKPPVIKNFVKLSNMEPFDNEIVADNKVINNFLCWNNSNHERVHF